MTTEEIDWSSLSERIFGNAEGEQKAADTSAFREVRRLPSGIPIYAHEKEPPASPIDEKDKKGKISFFRPRARRNNVIS